MPKRTNSFQKMVFMLQKQLAGQAVVTESKLVQNRDTGTAAEVDVVVETSVGQIPFVVGVECTAAKRPADIQWVHQMYGKHRALPIDATVLLSKSGYTKNASKQAEACKIRAMTIAEAEAADWRDVIEDFRALALGAFNFTAKGCTVHYDRSPPAAPDLTVSPNLMVNRGMPGDPIRFADLMTAIVSDQQVAIPAMRQWLATTKDRRLEQFDFSINWKPCNETIVAGSDGSLYRITQMDVKVAAMVASAPLSMSAGSFGMAKVAYGTADNIFDQSGDRKREVVVTMTRSDMGLSSGAIMIPKFEGGEDKVFDMRLGEADSEGCS